MDRYGIIMKQVALGLLTFIASLALAGFNPAQAQATGNPNILLVLDTSGSMNLTASSSSQVRPITPVLLTLIMVPTAAAPVCITGQNQKAAHQLPVQRQACCRSIAVRICTVNQQSARWMALRATTARMILSSA